jgi:hypothetical protein
MYTLVIADQPVKAPGPRKGIELLDDRAVPPGAPVLISPMSRQDHVGYVQDVQQVSVFFCGYLNVHGYYLSSRSGMAHLRKYRAFPSVLN